MQRSRRFVALVALPALLALAGCTTRYGATVLRPSDPVVLTGANLPKLTGGAPSHIVGFAWDGSAWHQIPVQVDERDMVSPGVIYHLPAASYPTLFGTTTPYLIPVYTPPASAAPGYSWSSTYTPSDSDPSFDANDELSFLVSDTGEPVGASDANPAGVDGSTREVVKTTDPFAPSHVGYVYLFHSGTLTGGGAGTDGVQYTFSLDSGAYTSTYKMGTGSLAPNNTWGFNPEHSTVTTPSYKETFADRWLNDGLRMTTGGATGVDVLDRAHYYATAGCARSEDTFDGGADNPGEGAFVANISGPVRAIRSYIGANSYKWTVNTDVFYPGRQDTVTELRGHAGLPGYGAADDFTTSMTGLTYSDPANIAVPIDGKADSVAPIAYTSGNTAPAMWQLVTGAQGSIVTVRKLDTSITGLNVTTVYQDLNPASPAQCTGDAAAWGQNGENVTSPVNNVPVTDPTLSATPATFTTSRFRYFSGPNLSPGTAASFNTQALNPVQTSVTG